jgi:hypothetical protein
MNNQKGEIVTGLVIVMMAGMMLFGMAFMHGRHGGHKEHAMCGQQGDSERGQHQVHHSDVEK